MTLSRQTFRYLMLASLLLSIMAAGLDLVFPELIPASVRDADEAEMENVAIARLFVIAGASLTAAIAALAAFVGLFLFKPWARGLNVLLCASTLLLWPLLGHSISSGWAQALGEVSLLIWGAVTAMSYLPPIAEAFSNGAE
jgi:hypothetical protein